MQNRIRASINLKSIRVPRLQVLPSFCRSQRNGRRFHFFDARRYGVKRSLRLNLFLETMARREGYLALIRDPYSKRPSFPVDGHGGVYEIADLIISRETR